MCRSQTVKSGMRTDKIVKKEKNRNKIVGGIERRKSLFGFIPCFELLVKAFDQVVGDIVTELWTRIWFHIQHCFYRNFVGTVTVGHDGSGFAKVLNGIKQGRSLRTIPVFGKMKAKDKTCFAVHN